MKPVAHLVFLHGWGGDRRLWQPLLDALGENGPLAISSLELPGFGDASDRAWPTDEQLLQQLCEQLPHNCVLVGHSLGGMLAACLAAGAGREKIAGLITIAANGSFLQRDDWPGMHPQTFAAFRQSLTAEPLATWEKFCGLQARGDSSMRAVLKQLKQWPPQSIGDAWGQALDCLARLDNRELLSRMSMPSLHIFGDRDALVPVAAAERLRVSAGAIEVLAGCGHVPQLSAAELVAEKIRHFLRDLNGGETPFDKRAVARSFGRAASSYDACAHLQRAVCRQLLREADSVWAPKTILDLGSGTGYGSELLRQRFPQAQILSLDLAEGMLQYARSERPVADGYIAADAEQLPLADGCVDLVFSSMALQWCYRLPQLFAELHRVLADGGRCLVATLGPGTLRELRDSWAQVDDSVHVNRFLPLQQWQEAAIHSGLPGDVRTEERVLHFDNVRQLMHELKSVGAHNVNRGADRGMTGRAKLRRLAAAYESLRGRAGLPASYDVIYLKLLRDAQGQLAGRA
ncbi:malonyl-CoA O-methyltransferase [Microbulbifer donghaiensis]|uniref:Malonyl-[acyl-carrier protein] O-methyltransferase n=1 Tax=Microbulbifer donghaiensis TaxID=494016 RepID=A0A1M5E405_9GAMM|nr:malonyl-ACP O-methyltransferase BioC [Microbulbifer donghaiensis]SHF73802.1 malonyl-CoA O-methyltransferase [Microbulbifer donghaiensis]